MHMDLFLYEGKLFQMKSEDQKRLLDLKQMLDASGTNQIAIHPGANGLFSRKSGSRFKKTRKCSK